jgi:hypothetical protein
MWLGFQARGCGEAIAMFEMRKEGLQSEGISAKEAAGVFGVAEITSVEV